MNDAIRTPTRMEIVERVSRLGPLFAKRTAEYDREARFPHENWEDLRDAGLLGIAVPVEAGGLGGDFVTYALASEELGRHCAATALTFNMHVATTLLVGEIADALDLTAAERTLLVERRELLDEGAECAQRGEGRHDEMRLLDPVGRRGSDVLKALALGADAVCLGRASRWGLGAFGEEGAQRVIEIINDELVHAMAAAGCADVKSIDRSIVRTSFP